MGCCQSTTSGDEGPPPNEIRASTQSDAALTASRSVTNIPESALSTPASGIIQPTATITTTQSLSNSTANRPNKPIRAPSPLRTCPADVSHLTPPWTRAQLAKERTAFFDTRVSGQPEVWTALALVCEMLQQDNVADAQGILDAMGVTCPSGRVAIGRGRDRVKGGIYDERGELYELPEWVVTDPEDIIRQQGRNVQEDTATHDVLDEGSSEKQPEETAATLSSSVQANRMQEHKHKGKGKAADLGEQIRIRLRLSDRGTDVVVAAGLKEPVLAIVARVQERIGGGERRRVRLLYLGHVLQEDKSLSAQGYRAGNVINAYVFEPAEDVLVKKDVIK